MEVDKRINFLMGRTVFVFSVSRVSRQVWIKIFSKIRNAAIASIPFLLRIAVGHDDIEITRVSFIPKEVLPFL
ncbi:hypothetical protein CEXT_595691 [Caerostris extrusa]|uniref:Uncharacterized protein n=1 Tax=Caerostris extrusa TaxID=172846 RepID=A0AAV4Y2W6_CAEEX|nr:hypothetical protein CEXT_595691 [Caerostris extrusa]